VLFEAPVIEEFRRIFEKIATIKPSNECNLGVDDLVGY
jgi:hypothetical protein